MKSAHLALCFHLHQPVDNDAKVFEQATAESYGPFLEHLERYPAVRCTLHVSGPLLEYWEDRQPALMDRLALLVGRDQVEPMGGGFYEPVLTMLTDEDRAGQIGMMADYLERRFGKRPTGLWLTERVWEQGLTRHLADLGVRYTLTDDTHFLAAGLEAEQLVGPYVTEDQGRILTVFPIAAELRYAIPFKDPEVTLELVEQAADESGERVLVYGDDGEKFGVWPETHESCYGEKRWLARWLEALSDPGPSVKLITCGEAAARLPYQGRVYLPDSSYREMNEWALPVERQVELKREHERVQARLSEREKDVPAGESEPASNDEVAPASPARGGFWRNFKARYAEAHALYCRTLAAGRALTAAGGGSDQARRELYRSQCNCPFWHGVFGGLYLPHLRHSVYTHACAAEELVLEAAGAALGKAGRDGATRVTLEDQDLDGRREAVLLSPELRVYLDPADGGTVYGLEARDKCFNLANNLTRRREAYHGEVGRKQGVGEGKTIHDRVVAKEEGLEHFLIYDKHLRRVFVDHVYGDGPAEAMRRCLLDERVPLEELRYRFEETMGGLTLRGEARRGHQALAVEKTVTLRGGVLKAAWKLVNAGEAVIQGRFTPEMNFSLLAGHEPDRYYSLDVESSGGRKLGDMSTIGDFPGGELALVDEWSGIRIDVFAEGARGTALYPVETVSQSEGGFERIYQCSSVNPWWLLQLAPGDTWEGQVELRVGDA